MMDMTIYKKKKYKYIYTPSTQSIQHATIQMIDVIHRLLNTDGKENTELRNQAYDEQAIDISNPH
jgi:hypothetical protein